MLKQVQHNGGQGLRSITSKCAVIGAALLLSAAAIAQAPAVNWTKRVSISAMGGHIIGNPAAKTKIVEYVSYTCSHCAAFETQSASPLKLKYIVKGTTSAEVRNYVRDPIDLTAALLARCGGATRFFGNHNAFMTSQGTWLATAQKADRATQESWYSGDFNTRLKKIATDMKFYDFMKARGFSAAQVNTCLTDKAAQDRIIAMTNYANSDVKISGTPSFTINGVLVDKAHDWKTLDAALAAR